MNDLGVVGGISPEGSAAFVRLLHEQARMLCGGVHSAPLRICQLDRHEVAALLSSGDWAGLGDRVEAAARGLVAGGAKGLLCDAAPLQLVADRLRATLGVPFLHGVDICATELKAERVRCAGFVGTRFVMEEKDLERRLRTLADIDIVLPSRADRDTIINMLDTELANGQTREESYVAVIRTMKALKRQGADVIVMVAPELSLLVHPEDISLPLRDAAQWHTRAAIKWALGNH